MEVVKHQGIEPRMRHWVIRGNRTCKSHASMLEIHLPKSPSMLFLSVDSQSKHKPYVLYVASSQGFGHGHEKRNAVLADTKGGNSLVVNSMVGFL